MYLSGERANVINKYHDYLIKKQNQFSSSVSTVHAATKFMNWMTHQPPPPPSTRLRKQKGFAETEYEI